MTIGENINFLHCLLFSSLLLSGLAVDALLYDYHFTHECLANPHKPQYNGGIVENPELEQGLKGWTAFGDAKIEHRVSSKGGNNTFIVARHRFQSHDSVSQAFYMEKGKLYTFSAWLQVSHGNAELAAVFKTPSGAHEHAGWAVAQSGCWSMLKGGLTVNASGLTRLYFESNNTAVEIWVDSISLQPFTEEQWRSHQQQSIDKARKSSMKFVAVDAKGNPLANATVSIQQKALNFPFGCAISKYITTNTAYQNWFASRFKVTVFENEMKWAQTEATRGREDYSAPDAMLQFARSKGIAVRGHNVYWDDSNYQPQWLYSLSPNDFNAAVDERARSLVKRYARQVIAWDAVNENMHHNFFETRLGPNASPMLFNKAHVFDFPTPLFLNEYNTIEQPGDGAVTPAKYLQKVQQMRAGGYRGGLGIGLQGHFTSIPNMPYMRSAIDQLAAAGLPIWLTEVDISSNINQAFYLEQVLREAHGHPRVNGIVLWSAWRPEGCYTMCLTDNNFRNLPTGDVVDKLLREWGGAGFSGTTDSNGHFETRLFHGDYQVTVAHPISNINSSSSVSQNFKVASVDDESVQQNTTLQVSV